MSPARRRKRRKIFMATSIRTNVLLSLSLFVYRAVRTSQRERLFDVKQGPSFLIIIFIRHHNVLLSTEYERSDYRCRYIITAVLLFGDMVCWNSELITNAFLSFLGIYSPTHNFRKNNIESILLREIARKSHAKAVSPFLL